MNPPPVNFPASGARLALLWAGLLTFAPASARAQSAQQNTNAIRPPDVTAAAALFGGLQAEQNEDGTTSAPTSPGDADLGRISLQTEGNFTSNAGLTDSAELEDFFIYSDLGVRYIPRITDTVFGSFSANYGLYRYNDHSSLDFDSFETTGGMMKVFSELDNLVVWANYGYTRLTEGHGGRDELLADHSLELGLYYPVPIREKHFAFASYLSSFSVAGDPDFARRNEHGLTLGYAFLPTKDVEFSAYYQVFYYDYLRNGRRDFLHDIGLRLERNFGRGVSVGLQASYSFNESNIRDGDYVVGEIGASLVASIQF
jgi:hypothetical protein